MSAVAPSRHAVADNLAHVVGRPADSDTVRRHVRRVFQVQAQNYFDMLRMRGTTKSDLEAIVHYSGADSLRNAIEKGRGAILVSGHVGNLDLIALHIGHMPHRTTAVIERLRPAELMDFVTGLRALTGIRFVPVDHAAMAVIRALGAGDLVYVAADLDLSGGGAVVPFFGEFARMPDTYARLARRYRVPVFYGTATRLDGGTIEAGCREVALPTFTSDEAADVAGVVRAVLACLEDSIREDPGQWVMFRRVWPGPGEPTPERDPAVARTAAHQG
jgi:KDO2-lipid IV(A) lauroyltransferase